MTYQSDGTIEEQLAEMTDDQRAFVEGALEKMKDMISGDDLNLPMGGTYLTKKSMEWKPELAVYMAMSASAMILMIGDDERSDVEKMEMISTLFMTLYHIGHHLGEAMTMAIVLEDMPKDLKDLFMLKMKIAEKGLVDLGD